MVVLSKIETIVKPIDWYEFCLDDFYQWFDAKAKDECWAWKGIVQNNGYGVFYYKNALDITCCLPAHRVAYAIANEDNLEGKLIDHKCRNRSCVNPSHLRICSHAQNMWNKGVNASNTSGYKGVSRYTYDKSKWLATIVANRKKMWLGIYETPEEASAAYVNAARELHGEFANYAGVGCVEEVNRGPHRDAGTGQGSEDPGPGAEAE